MKTKTQTAPWKNPAPKHSKHHTLTAGQKTAAAARAKRAGRHYPNLVDNMWASQHKKGSNK